MTFTTRAVIIKYQPYREYDRLYTAYTEDYGKLVMIARGSNRITSKLAGHLEPGVFSNLMIARGLAMEVLAQARTVESNAGLRVNNGCNRYALVILESLDKLTHTHEPDPAIFDLVRQTMRWLSARSDYNVIYYYLLHLLIRLGHAPDVRHQAVLDNLLVADISLDDIIVNNEARQIINQYLAQALDEQRLNSFHAQTISHI